MFLAIFVALRQRRQKGRSANRCSQVRKCANERKVRPRKLGGDADLQPPTALPPRVAGTRRKKAAISPVPTMVFEARQRKTRGFLPTCSHEPASRGDIIGRRLLPGFPHLSFRENFPTWNYLPSPPPAVRIIGTVTGGMRHATAT